MSANGETVPQGTSEVPDTGKGKGKAVEQTEMMKEEDEEDDEEESGPEEVQLISYASSFRAPY